MTRVTRSGSSEPSKAIDDPRELLARGVAQRELATTAVALVGEDVRRFANGMLTNNVRDLPVGGVQRTAMVDDRGRVVGLLDLLLVEEHRIVCLLEGVDADAFIERYDAYVFADDVEFERLDGLRTLTVQGPDAPRALEAASLPVPEEGRLVATGDLLVVRRDRGTTGFDLVGAELPSLDVPEATEACLEALRVHAGEPRWPVDFPEKALPHETGLRRRYLSFDKGCYVGQETIHRVEVLGRVRRQLVRLALGELPAQGAEVHHGGKVVGRLTSPVQWGEGALALAVLREPANQAGTTVEVHDAGRVLQATVLEAEPTPST